MKDIGFNFHYKEKLFVVLFFNNFKVMFRVDLSQHRKSFLFYYIRDSN